jgi:hypothetical protein
VTRQEAIQALRALGIRNPSRQLLEDYMRVQQVEEWALEVPEPSSLEPQGQQQTERQVQSPNPPEHTERPHPSSNSNLEPLLRERRELVPHRGPKRAGRPRIQAPWFQALANLMADGSIPLRQALHHLGVRGLAERQIRALYRSRALTGMRRKARQRWLKQGGITPRDRRRYACKGGEPLGISPKLLRLL